MSNVSELYGKLQGDKVCEKIVWVRCGRCVCTCADVEELFPREAGESLGGGEGMSQGDIWR